MKQLPSLSPAGMELRRFLRGRLPVAALVVLPVIPLLYGALYLYAFWDPYSRLNHVPAALVMADRAATASDGHPGPRRTGPGRRTDQAPGLRLARHRRAGRRDGAGRRPLPLDAADPRGLLGRPGH